MPFEGWRGQAHAAGDDTIPFVKFDPTLTSTMKVLEDAMGTVKIDAGDAAKSMQDSAEAARYWAAFDKEIAANQMTALKAESLAAANDARRNTRQFAMDPTQFKSDMQASVEYTAAVRDLTGEIGSNVEHMAEGSAGFNQEWEWLAAHTFTVNEGAAKGD